METQDPQDPAGNPILFGYSRSPNVPSDELVQWKEDEDPRKQANQIVVVLVVRSFKQKYVGKAQREKNGR